MSKKTDHKKLWRKCEKKRIDLANRLSRCRKGLGKTLKLLDMVADGELTPDDLKYQHGYGSQEEQKGKNVKDDTKGGGTSTPKRKGE